VPTLARSTPLQRSKLSNLAVDLQEAFDSLTGRFWATRDQRESYATVLSHLRAWADWESAHD
jgi:hypothetical protein